MTEPKFTRGPWRWDKSREYGYARLESDDCVVLEPGGMNDGDSPITWMGEEMTEADAALIVAAPELYAELERIDPNNPVLAKARGETE